MQQVRFMHVVRSTGFCVNMIAILMGMRATNSAISLDHIVSDQKEIRQELIGLS